MRNLKIKLERAEAGVRVDTYYNETSKRLGLNRDIHFITTYDLFANKAFCAKIIFTGKVTTKVVGGIEE